VAFHYFHIACKIQTIIPTYLHNCITKVCLYRTPFTSLVHYRMNMMRWVSHNLFKIHINLEWTVIIIIHHLQYSFRWLNFKCLNIYTFCLVSTFAFNKMQLPIPNYQSNWTISSAVWNCTSLKRCLIFHKNRYI